MSEQQVQWPIYVIAMARETERRDELSQSFAELGLPFEFFDGVDGRNLPAHYQKHYDPAGAQEMNGRELTPGELGCYASHVELWRKIAASDVPYALILESDARPIADTAAVVESIANVSVPWDMVLLHWTECIPSFWGRHRLCKDYTLVRFARKTYSAASYLLTPQGARILLDFVEPVVLPLDDVMTGGKVKKPMEIYGVTPAAARLSDQSLVSGTILDHERAVFDASRRTDKSRHLGKRLERDIRRFIYKIMPPPAI